MSASLKDAALLWPSVLIPSGLMNKELGLNIDVYPVSLRLTFVSVASCR